MATDPSLPPSLYGTIRDLRRRVEFAERAPRLTPQVFNSTPVGTLHDFGYAGNGGGAGFTPVFVAAGPVTAFVLDFDLNAQVSGGSPPPSAVSWRLLAAFGDEIPTLLAFDTLLPGDRSFGTADLITGLGAPGAAPGTILRVTIEIQSEGGSGGEALLRLNRPLLLLVRPPA